MSTGIASIGVDSVGVENAPGEISSTVAISATTENTVGSVESTGYVASSVTAIAATTADTVGAVTSVGDTSSGTFTSEVLRDNTGTILASVSLNHVAIYNDTTGALVVRKTGLSTNGSGVFSFSDAALAAGTTYRVDWETSTGTRRMPRKAAA